MFELVFILVKSLFLSPFFWLLLVAYSLWFIYLSLKPKFIGKIGEHFIDKSLKELPKEEYKIITDLMLELNGMTHQIDHIVVSKYGIFTIETKCYSGKIVGNEKDYYWYQYLKNNRYKLRNPIHQNYGHIKSLSEALNIDENKFISIICFTNQSKLKINSNTIVINRNNLVNMILRLSNEEKITNVDKIYKHIYCMNIIDPIKRREHVLKAKAKKKEAEDRVNNMMCPKCGGKLVKRFGKYGRFIGCSNYPKCNFIKK